MDSKPRKKLNLDLILAFAAIITATGVIYNKRNEPSYPTLVTSYPNCRIKTYWADLAMAVIFLVLTYLFIRYTVRFVTLLIRKIKKGGGP